MYFCLPAQFQTFANIHPNTAPTTKVTTISVTAVMRLNAVTLIGMLSMCKPIIQFRSPAALPVATSATHTACTVAKKQPSPNAACFSSNIIAI